MDEAIRCKQEKELAFERKLFEVNLKFEEELQQAKLSRSQLKKRKKICHHFLSNYLSCRLLKTGLDSGTSFLR